MTDSNKRCVAIFDEGKTTEKKFYFDNLNENLSTPSINFSAHYSINETLPQNLKDFVDYSFSTLKVLNLSNIQIPVYGDYSNIAFVNTNFFGTEGLYNIDLRAGNE